MVLMTAGDELDPVFFDSLAPVIALTYALWDGWMPPATTVKCIKAAQNEQPTMRGHEPPSKVPLAQSLRR